MLDGPIDIHERLSSIIKTSQQERRQLSDHIHYYIEDILLS